jgi:hypothetical protein
MSTYSNVQFTSITSLIKEKPRIGILLQKLIWSTTTKKYNPTSTEEPESLLRRKAQAGRQGT